MCMSLLQALRQGLRYEIRTRVNKREPLFGKKKALAVFDKVFWETKPRFAFETRGPRVEGDLLGFCSRPEEGDGEGVRPPGGGPPLDIAPGVRPHPLHVAAHQSMPGSDPLGGGKSTPGQMMNPPAGQA
jgi:hypothetical protein